MFNGFSRKKKHLHTDYKQVTDNVFNIFDLTIVYLYECVVVVSVQVLSFIWRTVPVVGFSSPVSRGHSHSSVTGAWPQCS